MNEKSYIVSKIKLSEVFFFLAYGMYLLFSILNTSFYATYLPSGCMKFVILMCVCILFFKELLCYKLSYKEFIYLLICIIMSILILYHVNRTVMIPFFLLIYSSRNIKFKKIAKFTIIETSILFIIIVISAKLGIILNYIYSNNGRIREYLGFRYSLYPQILMFNITALDLYIYKDEEKTSVIRHLFLGIINFWVFKHTDSRLSFYLSILLIFSMFILKIKPDFLVKKKVTCFTLGISFIICSVLSLHFIINYDSSNANMQEVDSFLEKRLSLGHNSLSIYKINLFGNNVNFVGNGLDLSGETSDEIYNYVDCMYLNILEKYGIVYFIIFISLLTYISFKALKDKNYQLVVIFTILALRGILDDLEMYLYYNTFWFMIGEYFIKQISKMNTNKKRKIADKEYKNEI